MTETLRALEGTEAERQRLTLRKCIGDETEAFRQERYSTRPWRLKRAGLRELTAVLKSKEVQSHPIVCNFLTENIGYQ